MGTQQLTEKELDILTLYIVDECIKFADISGKSFEEVLNEDVFANKASTEFAENICKRIESLNAKGYISGTAELEYEMEYDMETFEETATESIDFAMCTFSDISISLKGKAYMGIDNLKNVSKDFMEKSKPIIKCIATTALQTAVKSAVTVGLKAVGFSV